MIWFLTTAASEVLAIRRAMDDLPESFPAIRAGSPYGTTSTSTVPVRSSARSGCNCSDRSRIST